MPDEHSVPVLLSIVLGREDASDKLLGFRFCRASVSLKGQWWIRTQSVSLC